MYVWVSDVCISCEGGMSTLYDMYVCMYAYMYVCMYVRMLGFGGLHTHIVHHTYKHTHSYTQEGSKTPSECRIMCIHVCVCVYTHVCMYVCTHAGIRSLHTYIVHNKYKHPPTPTYVYTTGFNNPFRLQNDVFQRKRKRRRPWPVQRMMCSQYIQTHTNTYKHTHTHTHTCIHNTVQ
jgi:hypothetical protein